MNYNFKRISEKYNVSESDLRLAISRLENNESTMYAMAGKMGAGKDTIGDLIAEDLTNKGHDIMQASYSTPMRKEIDDIIQLYQSGMLGIDISKLYEVEVEEVMNLIKIIKNDSIYHRTEKARLAIQYWGTDVRRNQYSNYWIDKLVKLSIESINNGKTVYISDVRFANEADSILDIGGKVIKLEVPEEVRSLRIFERDGLWPTSEQLNHLSEVNLDNYEFERTFDGCETPAYLKSEALKYILNIK